MLLLAVIIVAFSACQNKITLPDLTFKTDTGYVFEDMIVSTGDTVKVGIIANSVKKGQVLKTFKVIQAYDTQTPTTLTNETLTSSQSAEYTKDIEIITRSQAGTESYTFSILDEEGLENSISLTLTVQ